MLRKMELTYTIKIRIYLLFLYNLLVIIFIFRFKNFKFFIDFLKSVEINKTKINIDEKVIFVMERKLSRFFKIKKCLITSSYLFKTLKDLGYEAKFFIGIKKESNFESHAWVMGKENNYSDKKISFFKEILII